MEFVKDLVMRLVEVANDQSRDYRILHYRLLLNLGEYPADQLDAALQSRSSGMTREQIIRKAISLLVLDEGVGIFNAQMEIYAGF